MLGMSRFQVTFQSMTLTIIRDDALANWLEFSGNEVESRVSAESWDNEKNARCGQFHGFTAPPKEKR